VAGVGQLQSVASDCSTGAHRQYAAEMRATDYLDTFWFSFPRDPRLPLGIGVTAFSEEDARLLMDERGVAEWFVEAREVTVRRGIRIGDLELRHVQPNVGPLHLRGVWYPCMNVGFGAPKV